MGTPNELIELEHLNRDRPTLTDTDAVIAAWYREKATVLDLLGLADGAVIARAHADRLDHTNGDGLVAA